MENDYKELIQQEKREYFKKWRRENPEKVKQNNQNYWRRRVERKLQGQKKEAG